MDLPKVYTLILSMTAKEQAALAPIIAAENRLSLTKLYAILIKSDREALEKLDKGLLYQKITGKQYSPSQDYLWRHELRLLGSLVERYLAQEMISAELKQSPTLQDKYLLKYYLSRNLFGLLDTEGEALKARAAKDYDYRTVIDACTTLEPYLSNYSWNNLAIQERMEQNVKDHQEAVARHFLHTYRRGQALAYGSKIFKYKEDFKPTLHELELDRHFENYEDPYSQFLLLKIATIGIPKFTQPQLYLDGLAHLAQHPNIPNAAKEKFFLLNNLSAYYFFHHQYELAYPYNVQLMELTSTVDEVYRVAAVYNLASNLAHLGRYSEALESMAQYQKLIAKFPNQAERFGYIEACCYALSGDRSAFQAAIPPNFESISRITQYYYRFLISISHYIDQEYDPARAEVDNMTRSIKVSKTESLNYLEGVKQVSAYMKQYYDLHSSYRLKGNTKKLVKDLAALHNETANYMLIDQMTSSTLFYFWLRAQIQTLRAKLGDL